MKQETYITKYLKVSPLIMYSPKIIHQEPKNGKYTMKHLDTI